MPLAVTLLGSATFNTSSGTKTVTATPAVGDLIVIIAAHTGTSSLPAPTDNNSSGTYTVIAAAQKHPFTTDEMRIYVRDSLIASASSTVFSHAPGSTSGGGLAVLKITGSAVAGSAAVRQYSGESTNLNATPAPVFSSAALASSAIIGALFSGDNPAGVTERSIYTELLDTGYGSPTTGLEVMSLDSGETGTVISWGSSVSSVFCDLVLEISGPAEIDAPLFVNTNTFYAPIISTTYALTAPLFANSNSFHAATVTPGSRTIAPSLLTNTNTFYAATVSGPGVLSPGLFVNTNTFYGATIGRGAVTLAPPLFANTNTFYAASIGVINTISAPLFVNENTFYGANFRGWQTKTDDATVWTEVVNTSALTDENGEQITEGGNPITAPGDETWTPQTNDATSWTQAA